MSDSALFTLLRHLQQEFRQEVARAVQLALAECRGAAEPLPAAPEIPVLLSVREAAAFLQVSVATVHAWKRQGLLTYRKIGNRTLFERAALLAAAAPQAVFDGRRSTPRRKAPPRSSGT